MKCTRFVVAFTGISLCLAAGARASDVKVIANTSVKASEISVDELKAIFLVVHTSFNGSAVVPVLARSGPAHDAFLREYLGKTDTALATYFRGLVFAGKASAPRTYDSDAAIIAYIAKTKGAIGYVGTNAFAPGTKTLEVK